jgi:CRISPR-associated RAMP protein, csm5 family
MKLTTLSPIFIGDGKKLIKKEYIYDGENKKIIIPDLMKMVKQFENYNINSEYEIYISNKNDKNGLGEWIKNKRGNLKMVFNFTKYVIDFKNADPRDAKGKFDLNEIATFIKDPYGLPYVPGSSIKGMIRTALLCYEIANNDKLSNLLNQIYEKSKGNSNSRPHNLKEATVDLENEIFKSMNKSIMRGLIIGDSRPLKTSDLTLSKKIDYTIGKNENLLPIYRESIKPEVDIYFDISIDSLVDNTAFPYSMANIFEAVNLFNQTSNKYFYSIFDRENKGENIVYLGGGTGFLSKTMIYPAFAKFQTYLKNLYKDLDISKDKAEIRYRDEKISKAVEVTHRIFKRTLNEKVYYEHNHDIDLLDEVSPHTCKCTRYNGKLYNMGICKLDYA